MRSRAYARPPAATFDADVAVVAMKVRLKVAHRYTHTVHLHRDAGQDGTGASGGDQA
jgi:hypothetical protein